MIAIIDEKLDEAEIYMYLGQMITLWNDRKNEIKRRLIVKNN